MSDRLFESGEDVMDAFHSLKQDINRERAVANLKKGYMVTTEVRRDIMTSDRQGQIAMNGCYHKINFDNLHGGVWRVYIDLESPG